MRQQCAAVQFWSGSIIPILTRNPGIQLREAAFEGLGGGLWLRKVIELLSTTHLKVEAISHEVGSMNLFIFSNTFNEMDRLAAE